MEGAAIAVTSSVGVGSFVRCSYLTMGGVHHRVKATRLRTFASSSSRHFDGLRHARKCAEQSRFTFAAALDDAASIGTKLEDSPEGKASTTDSNGNGLPKNNETQQVEAVSKEIEDETRKTKIKLNEVVDNLKDVLKLQDATKQVYTESAEKAIGVLRDTTEQLKEQAEKARVLFMATAQETAEKGKENLTLLAENTEDPIIKDIAKAALGAHAQGTTKQGAKIHDFCLGIPYGGFLAGGGLLWFLVTGSTAAIRFGLLLGGLILALSITSLKAWKRGESSIPHITAQAAITFILFAREIRRFSEVKAVFPHAAMAVISAGMLVFYSYVYVSGGNPPKKVKADDAAAATTT